MKIDFNKLFKGALIFSFLLVAFSFFYYLVIFLPAKEKNKTELKEKQYNACLEKCDSKYPNKLNITSFGDPDYKALFEVCNNECGEKYAGPFL